MVKFLQFLVGLSEEEARYVAALIGIVAAFFTILGTGTSVITYRLGQLMGWRDYRRSIDRYTVRCQRFIVEPGPDGKMVFVVETAAMESLSTVFGTNHLAKIVANAVGIGEPGRALLPPGRERYRALARASSFVTGNNEQASQSAMFGRFDEYHCDMTAVMLTWARGDDGESVPRILMASPELLDEALNEKFIDELPSLRASYEHYKAILREMAKAFQESNEIFANVPDHREAGGSAEVWLVMNRTPKIYAGDEENIRTIVRQELRS